MKIIIIITCRRYTHDIIVIIIIIITSVHPHPYLFVVIILQLMLLLLSRVMPREMGEIHISTCL